MRIPRVRAVVLNYKRIDLTLNCIKSLCQQSYNLLDIVVVDNSVEDSYFIELRKKLPPKVVAIKAEKNLGYAAGNNLGIFSKQSPDFDYALVVNNDTILNDRDSLVKMINAIESSEEIVACSPLVDTLPTGLPVDLQIQVRRVPDFYTLLIASSWWLNKIPFFRNKYNNFIYNELRPFKKGIVIRTETINGSCFLIKKSFLDQIGGLDQGTFLYFEEIILGKQIKELDKRVCLVTNTTILHDQGATSHHNKKSYNISMDRERLKSELYYCEKYLKITKTQKLLLKVIRLIDLRTKSLVYKFR